MASIRQRRLRGRTAWAACLGAAAVLAACTPATRYYAEPGRKQIYASDLHFAQPPKPVRVDVEYLRDGVCDAKSEALLRRAVATVLNRSHTLAPVADPDASAVLQVKLDDVSGGKGRTSRNQWVGALTLGAGTRIDKSDDYRFQISYADTTTPRRFGLYREKLRTVVNRHPGDYGDRGPYGFDDAFTVITADALLNFLHDMQNAAGQQHPVMFVPDATP
jgi:hypothetical protein